MSFLSSIWDVIWLIFTVFVFVAYLTALFSIITDLFRDRQLKGIYKAIWLIFLLFFPILTALVYLIARGQGMGERSAEQAQSARAATDDYIRTVTDSEATPAAEIQRAKALLDAGAINQAEYETLKSNALSKATS